jgi:tetratricopeptide (TPR) repeat protein
MHRIFDTAWVNIFQLEPPTTGKQGDHLYRTSYPCRALGQREGVLVGSGNWLSYKARQCARRADLLVLCATLEPDLLALIRARRRDGLITIFEINDDFRDVQEWSHLADFAANPLTRSLNFQLAVESDAVQFSMPHFLEVFAPLNSRAVVFQNYLWELPPPRAKPARIRIGWGGSYGHRDDLIALLPALKRVLVRHPEVDLAIMSVEGFRPLFDWVEPERLFFKKAGSLADYYDFISSLHIGLAPLLPSKFNRGRSDVKYLEYAAAGAAAVCSALRPYETSVRPGVNGLFAQEFSEFADRIEQLLDAPRLLADIQRAAHQYVCSERMQRVSGVDERLDFYRMLLKERAEQRVQGERVAEFRRLLLDGNEAFGSGAGTYVEVEWNADEQALYRNLISSGDPGERAAVYRDIAARQAHDHLPRLCLGLLPLAPEERLKALVEAGERSPRSVSTFFSMATVAVQLQDQEAARQSLDYCQTLAPRFGAAYEQKGALLEEVGEREAAIEVYREGISANPYLRTIYDRLVRLLLADGRSKEAAEVLWRSRIFDPWPEQMALAGTLYYELGDRKVALDACLLAHELGGSPRQLVVDLARSALEARELEEVKRLLALVKGMETSQ